MISIVIPCYNAAQYLREALESVLGQTYSDWECICTDDGSEDDTGVILDQYASQDKRFVVIHQANRGEGSARNVALERVRGDWFLYLDSDDVLRSSALDDVMRVIQREPNIDLIGYGIKQFNEGSDIEWDTRKSDYLKYDCRESLSYGVNTIGVCQLAYRSARFLHVRFNRLKIGADLVYVSECLSFTNSIAKIGCVEYGCRVRAQSMSHKERTPSMMLDTIDFRRMTFEILAKSRKHLDTSYVRTTGNQWLEHVTLFINKPYDSEWQKVWKHWFDSLDCASEMPFFTSWQRFVISILRLTRSRLIARILCDWPCRLKKAGIHR